jgi:hypothetical protein
MGSESYRPLCGGFSATYLPKIKPATLYEKIPYIIRGARIFSTFCIVRTNNINFKSGKHIASTCNSAYPRGQLASGATCIVPERARHDSFCASRYIWPFSTDGSNVSPFSGEP